MDTRESKRVSEWCWLWRSCLSLGRDEVWADGFSPLCGGPPWMWRMGVWGSGETKEIPGFHTCCAHLLLPSYILKHTVTINSAPLLPSPGPTVQLSVSSSVSSSMYCNEPSQALCCVTFLCWALSSPSSQRRLEASMGKIYDCI